MAYSSAKISVRDSFDDEEVSDDVEDEVFIRDGRNGFKMDEERGVKRPLMAPRRKIRSTQFHGDSYKASTWKILCAPFCYGFVALSALLGLIMLVVFAIMWFPLPLDQITFWKTSSSSPQFLIPCTEIIVEDVWIKNFPKLTTESIIQLNDINKDGIPDAIIGYGTGADGLNLPSYLCELYFHVSAPCLGGVLALDGRNGKTLWQHWTAHTILITDCSGDVTNDKINDCLISGKGGVLQVLNGHDGSLVWQFPPSKPLLQIDVYSAQFIQDIDGDNIIDVLTTHTKGAQRAEDLVIGGHLVLISGRNGNLLQIVATPDEEETYFPPQILVRSDGESVILFGTGGQTSSGGLYVLPLHRLMSGSVDEKVSKLQVKTLYKNEYQGVMSPAVLADINNDKFEDIIISTFNSTVLAFDGLTFKQIWNYSFPESETFSMPVPGLFNSDEIPDFLVKYQTGSGFPIYFYSQTTVLNGHTGSPLPSKMMIDTAGSQIAGLSVSVEGFGNDLFLHWTADCQGHEGEKTVFGFMPGISIQDQSRADLCKLRFNSTLTTKLRVYSQHLPPPGIIIYSSDERKDIEYNNSQSSYDEVQKYFKAHPDFRAAYARDKTVVKPQFSTEMKELNEANPEITPPKYSHKDGSPDSDKESNLYFPSHEYAAQQRSHNEEIMPSYSGKNDYPTIHKHGSGISNQIKGNTQWQMQWPNEMSSNENLANPSGSVLAQYQNINPESLGYENPGPSRDADYETFYDPTSSDVGYARKNNRNQRKRVFHKRKRDVNTKNITGIQRPTSAGVLAPSLPTMASDDSIDIIFSTHWIFPSSEVSMLSKTQMKCIQKYLGKYMGLDHGDIEAVISKECFDYVDLKNVKSKSEFDIFNINMGQMTVYRIKLRCRCRALGNTEQCTRILPMKMQSWPTSTGVNGNGLYKIRDKTV